MKACAPPWRGVPPSVQRPTLGAPKSSTTRVITRGHKRNCAVSNGVCRAGFNALRAGARPVAGKLHRHVLNQRNDFQHKVSRELVNHYGRIVVEDLNVQGLAGGRLAKSVHDAAWSSFIAKLLDRAESADRVLGKVDPRGTSQPCPCGKPAPKKLWNRLHKCSWGLNTTRDHASALEILGRGLRRRTETPARAGVALEAPRLSDGA